MRTKARAEARLAGELIYRTGLSCSHGHVADRYTKSGMCVECSKMHMKIRVITDGRLRAKKQSKAQLLAKALVRNAKWRMQNLEKDRAYKRKWSKANAEKERAKCQRRRARLLGAEGSYSSQDIEKMLIEQAYKCKACGVSVEVARHVDHIIPLSKGGTNWPHNLQVLCPACNRKKSDKI